MTSKEELENFGQYLLEKEMMLAAEMAESNDSLFSGAFTWINAIRHEFKGRFLND